MRMHLSFKKNSALGRSRVALVYGFQFLPRVFPSAAKALCLVLHDHGNIHNTTHYEIQSLNDICSIL